MQPEDIDKLFRDRLAEHAPAPPAYLWNQLEEELQPEKKRPVLWLWAAAASVVLLLVSGVLWLQLGASGPATEGTLATAPQPAAQPEKKTGTAPETQATPPRQLASTTLKEAAAETPAAPLRQSRQVHLPARQLAAAPVSESNSRRASRAARATSASNRLKSTPAPEALAATIPKTQPERSSEPVEAPSAASRQLPATALAAANPATTTGPIEVEVRRSDAETAVATAAQPIDSGPRPRLGQLLRLGRSAVRGDRVTLADAGLPETVTVQARVAGRTLTKVIQL